MNIKFLVMKKILLFLFFISLFCLEATSQVFNRYKYIIIIDDGNPYKLEQRITDFFTNYGMTVYDEVQYKDKIDEIDKRLALFCSYNFFLNSNGPSKLTLKFYDENSDVVYEDYGTHTTFMSPSGDLKGCAEKIFKRIAKYEYQFEDTPRVAEILGISKEELDSLISRSIQPGHSGVYINSESMFDRVYCNDLDDNIVFYSLTELDGLKYGDMKFFFETMNVDSYMTGMAFGKFNMECNAVWDEVGNTVAIAKKDGTQALYVKKKSSQKQNSKTSNPSASWTGTGFALNSGYIVTNYHVVENSNTINVLGVNGDFLKSYEAKIVGSDKSNDLALLKLVDSSVSFSVPYKLSSSIADVGEGVFVLGYPLTAAMGEDVKLTNGIISSRTGFEGNTALYQISAPVQPGNSGSPLFDDNGNLIGIVNAHLDHAENVSYAIKSSYLKILVESVANLNILPTTSQIEGKSLKEQVKAVSPYVFLIKCT